MCQTSSSFKYVLIRCQALPCCSESCTAYGTHALFTTVCSCAIAVSTAALHTRYTTYERHARERARSARATGGRAFHAQAMGTLLCVPYAVCVLGIRFVTAARLEESSDHALPSLGCSPEATLL
jgi:hypothetical protein